MTHRDPQAFTRSPEQEAIRQHLLTTTSSLVIKAYAGTGKTATLIDNLPVIVLTGEAVVMAFNRKMADELMARIAKLPVEVRFKAIANTAHSLGFDAWKKSGRKSRVQGGKLNFLLQDLFEEHRVPKSNEHPVYAGRASIKKMVSFAKNAGFGLSSEAERFPRDCEADWTEIIDHFNLWSDLDQAELKPDEAIKWASRLLTCSNDCERMIDFDDMIYLTLLKRCKIKQYPNVVVDEAQDTNATRREFALRSLAPGGRLIAVGDDHQAIYGFTGADAHALRNIKRRIEPCAELPLSVCWRCEEKIIEYANRWVPAIRSFDTDGRGEVRELSFDQDFFDELQNGDAVLCRLNRPNVSVAIALLRRGKTARIEGRDLGNRLLEHCRKASPDLPALARLQQSLNLYEQHQAMLLIEHEKHVEAAMLSDEIAALEVLIDRCLEQGRGEYTDLEALCNELFVDEAGKADCILLSSVHKAKGLEWDRVYALGMSDYMPFFLAKLPHELVQEDNLCYVLVTRARHELVLVSGVEEGLKAGIHRAVPRLAPKPDLDTLSTSAIDNDIDSFLA